MEKLTLKRLLPFILLAFLLVPITTSSLLDLKEKKEKERMEEIERQIQEQEKIYLLGKFDQTQRKDFVLVARPYTVEGNKIYLRKEVYEAYLKMREAALLEGVDLKIVSATRNFEYQKGIWNKKWSGATLVDGKNLSKTIPDGTQRFKKILEYSAAPATSRHHWGTDIDINGVNPPYFNSEKGKKEYAWLVKNASAFGFCQTYNEKDASRPTGYNEEKWHWSYMPIASELTEKYKTLVQDEDITGFLGDEYAPTLDLINNYVLAINPDCI